MDLVPLILARDPGDIDEWKGKYTAFVKSRIIQPGIRGMPNSQLFAEFALAFGVATGVTRVTSAIYGAIVGGTVSYGDVVVDLFVLSVFVSFQLRVKSARTVISNGLFFLAIMMIAEYGLGVLSLPSRPVTVLKSSSLFSEGLIAIVGALVFILAFVGLQQVRPLLIGTDNGEGLALWLIVSVLYRLDNSDLPYYRRDDRAALAVTLGRLADEIEFAISGHVPGLVELPREVQWRFSGAAERIRSMMSWVVLPQRGTSVEMRNVLVDYFAAIFTGRLHYLPFVEPGARTVRRLVSVRRIAISAAVGLIPTLLLLVGSAVGVVPPAWHATLTAVAGVSLILAAASAVRPSSANAIKEARELLAEMSKAQ